MSETKFTPGPWEVMTTDVSHNVWSPEGILTMTTSWHRNDRKTFALKDEALANARLTAAAPDLLAFAYAYAETWVAAGGMPLDGEDLRDMCLSAIAKAEGRT
jgi:hypothetical protein